MTSYPTYRSPIGLLSDLGVDLSEISTETLKLERKKLLLESQLSENQTIQVKGRVFTKNDIIQTFDELKSTSDLAHHQRIYSLKPLLNLLEDYSVTTSKMKGRKFEFKFKTEEEMVEFKRFVSPFLANAFDRLLSRTIRNSGYDEFENVLHFSSLLLDHDAFFAFRKFDAYCSFLEERLENTHFVKETFPFNDFLFLRAKEFYTITNKVNEYYLDIADRLAITLINFCGDQHWSSGRSNHLYKMYDQMCRLNCSQEYKSHIYSNRGPFKRDTLLQITDHFGIGKRYLLKAGIVLMFVLPALIFGNLSSPSDEQWAQFEARQAEKDQNSVFEQVREDQRLQTALEQQVRIHPYSYMGKTKFDTTAFRVFRDSVYSKVLGRNFKKNTYNSGSAPQLISPLIMPDSSLVIPFGRKSKLWNETNSELLMIIMDKNALSSYYVPAQGIISIEIDPGSFVFFYSGNDWNSDDGIQFKHPYKSLMSDSITIALNGSFNKTSSKDWQLMQTIFYLRNGSKKHLCLKEVDGMYRFNERKIRRGYRYEDR